MYPCMAHVRNHRVRGRGFQEFRHVTEPSQHLWIGEYSSHNSGMAKKVRYRYWLLAKLLFLAFAFVNSCRFRGFGDKSKSLARRSVEVSIPCHLTKSGAPSQDLVAPQSRMPRYERGSGAGRPCHLPEPISKRHAQVETARVYRVVKRQPGQHPVIVREEGGPLSAGKMILDAQARGIPGLLRMAVVISVGFLRSDTIHNTQEGRTPRLPTGGLLTTVIPWTALETITAVRVEGHSGIPNEERDSLPG